MYTDKADHGAGFARALTKETSAGLEECDAGKDMEIGNGDAGNDMETGNGDAGNDMEIGNGDAGNDMETGNGDAGNDMEIGNGDAGNDMAEEFSGSESGSKRSTKSEVTGNSRSKSTQSKKSEVEPELNNGMSAAERIQFVWSREQRNLLQSEFKVNPNPSKEKLVSMAEMFGVLEWRVKKWFINKRFKRPKTAQIFSS